MLLSVSQTLWSPKQEPKSITAILLPLPPPIYSDEGVTRGRRETALHMDYLGERCSGCMRCLRRSKYIASEPKSYLSLSWYQRLYQSLTLARQASYYSTTLQTLEASPEECVLS